RAVFLCLAWLGSIEFAQLWYNGHSPETTDLIVTLGMAVWIKLYRPPDTPAPVEREYRGPERRRSSFKRQGQGR
ncbi:MAG: VanZ family protein, partial [Desulfobacteraceae bacterium]